MAAPIPLEALLNRAETLREDVTTAFRLSSQETNPHLLEALTLFTRGADLLRQAMYAEAVGKGDVAQVERIAAGGVGSGR